MRVLLALVLFVLLALSVPASAQLDGCGGGVCAPGATITPTVDVNFAASAATGCASITSCLSVTRSTQETCTDASGSLTYASANNACVTNAGLQIYGGTTNLLLQSGFASGWGATGATLTANNQTSPDGTSNAAKLIEGAGGTFHFVSQSVTKAASPLTYAMSVYVSPQTRQLALQMDDGSTNGITQYYNITTGTITALQTFGSGFVQNTAYCVSAAHSFQRCTLVITTNSATTIRVIIALANGTSFGNNNYSGGGTLGAYIFGPQLEQQSFSYPYIATTTAAVAASADNIVASSVLASTLAESAGTLMLNTNSSQQAPAATMMDANGTVLLGKTANGVATTSVGATLSTKNVGPWLASNKTSLSWNGSGGILQLSGGPAVTDATSRTPAGPFAIGSTSGSSAFLNGNIARIRLYNTKIPTGSPLPPLVILDNDGGTDVDNANATRMFNNLALAGVINPLAYIASDADPFNVSANKALRNFQALSYSLYAYQGSLGQTNSDWTHPVTTAFNNGDSRSNYADCEAGYRTLLAGAATPVTIILAGPATCVDLLLESAANDNGDGLPSGLSLIQSHVAKVVWVAGSWPSGCSVSCVANGDFNMNESPAATADLLANWPSSVPFVFYGVDLIITNITGVGANLAYANVGPFPAAVCQTSASDPYQLAYFAKNSGLNPCVRPPWDESGPLVASLIGSQLFAINGANGSASYNAATGIYSWTATAGPFSYMKNTVPLYWSGSIYSDVLKCQMERIGGTNWC